MYNSWLKHLKGQNIFSCCSNINEPQIQNSIGNCFKSEGFAKVLRIGSRCSKYLGAMMPSHHRLKKRWTLSCNGVIAMCHAMICDVSWCANLRLPLIFWNLWRLLLQRLMYLKHQVCDNCDSLFNEFNVFCVFAYEKTWKYGKSMILSEAVKHLDWGVHHFLE